MRTVENYRGLQVYVLDRDEEVPTWVRTEVSQGRAVMATGEFKTTAALAHILDLYIDEVLRAEADPSGRFAGPATRSWGGPR